MALLVALIMGAILAVIVVAVDTCLVWLAFALLHDVFPSVPHIGFGASVLVAVVLWLLGGAVIKGARN